MDECTVDQLTCQNGQCINIPGSYRCECEMGFARTEDEKACEGKDYHKYQISWLPQVSNVYSVSYYIKHVFVFGESDHFNL